MGRLIVLGTGVLVAVSLVAPPVARAEAPAPPRIKVLSTGKAPTRQLRFEAKNGAKVTIEVVEQGAMARGPRGKLSAPQPTPTVRTTLDVDVSDVQPNGDFRIDVVYRRVEADAKALKPERARAINSQLAGVVGAKFQTVVTARGITKETALSVPSIATPEQRTKLETFHGVQGQIVVPFPEEPVGIGSRWESTVTVQGPDAANGLVAQQTTTYELAELAGSRGKLVVALSQRGKTKDGKLTTSVRGNGEIAFDLASVGVVSARIETRTELTSDDGDMHLDMVNTGTRTLTGRARE